MEFLQANWGWIAGIIVPLVIAILNHFGKQKYASMLTVVVDSIEAQSARTGSKEVKDTVKAQAIAAGVQEALHEFVKEKTS